MMDKIDWCLKQKSGIKLIEPNNNLCEEYFKSAEENLDAMLKLTGKWKSITAYYACYEAIYAILQKIGIKCDIHECTLELLNLIENINEELKNFILDLKKERIDIQYYLKEPKKLDEDKVKEFVLSCKAASSLLTENQINEVRNKLGVKNDWSN
jgi:uncharacterized protein (UPF0332 family)|tara:strand:- start:112 stop:573 length:462 start_codon:yes stop_codon:yes gene_type:complete